MPAGNPPSSDPPSSDPDPPAAGAPGRLVWLLGRTAEGDQAAFAELYDATAPRLYGMALRVLRDTHQTEEVVQEVFLTIWQTAARYESSRGSALAWMTTMAHRRAVDRVRSSESARRRDLAEGGKALEVPFDQTADAAHASLDADRVRAALGRLPALQHRALDLAYFGGHTHSEVARITKVPLGTAKTRIRDGLQKLRELMVVPASETA